MGMTMKLNLVLERILSSAILNHVGFKMSGLGRHRDIDDYHIPVSVFKRYWVRPSEINKMTDRSWKPWTNRIELLGRVQDGEWDEHPSPISEKILSTLLLKSSRRILQM